MPTVVRLLLPCLVAAAPLAAQARVAPAEQRVATAIQRAVPDALRLLERAVNINSGSMNLAGVREVGRVFAPEFEAVGFTTRWVDGAAWGRAGHLIAERRGGGTGPKVMVVLTGDEENSGRPFALSRADLITAAEWADIAIGFEDGAGDPRSAVVARRGYTDWTLRTAGRPFHSSQIFRSDVGSGAVYEAARILTAWHDSLSTEPFLTFNPGVIVGGTAITLDGPQARGTAFGRPNVVAESTVVAGDLRTLTLEQRERAKAAMQAIVARHRPQTGATVTFTDGFPPQAPAEGSRRLLALYDEASRALGHGPVAAEDPARAGAADIAFTSGLVDMALDGIGLMGSGGHTVLETADLRTLPTQAARVAVTLARLSRAP